MSFQRNKLFAIAKTLLVQQKKNYNLAWIQNNNGLLFNCYSKTMEECNICVFFFYSLCTITMGEILSLFSMLRMTKISSLLTLACSSTEAVTFD